MLKNRFSRKQHKRLWLCRIYHTDELVPMKFFHCITGTSQMDVQLMWPMIYMALALLSCSFSWHTGAKSKAWWHNYMEMLSALLALCEGNPTIPHTKLSKRFQMPQHSCDVTLMLKAGGIQGCCNKIHKKLLFVKSNKTYFVLLLLADTSAAMVWVAARLVSAKYNVL